MDKMNARALLFVFPCLLIFFAGCATNGRSVEEKIKRSYLETDKSISISKDVYAKKEEYTAPSPPDFRPAVEDVSPLKLRMVEIVVRATPLREVIQVIAQVCGLNLIFEKGVETELPVTVTLKNVTAEYALNAILSSTDYSYQVSGQTLIIKPTVTKVFEISIPSVLQTYKVDVGGDILGTAGSETSTSIKGNVAQTLNASEKAMDLWSSMEEALKTIVGGADQGASAVIINRASGTIQVTTTRRKMELVEQYISRMKEIMNRQVIIEAKVLEVSLNEGFSYGIDWQYIASGLNLRTENFSSIVGARSPAMALEGFKIFGTGASLQSIVRAIENQGEIRVLSSPRLNIMNGQTALLTVGTNQTYLSKVQTTVTTGGTTPITNFTVETSSILSGIMIGIVPFVNEKGEIFMTITPIVSDLVSLNQKSVGNQLEISLPTVELRELSTSVKARNGETIILGGLIAQKERMEDSQVPVLGKIPLLGLVFKSREKVSRKSEIVVLLQPNVVTR